MMVELKITGHDGLTDTRGLAMWIRDHSGCHIREAKALINHVKEGNVFSLDVDGQEKLVVMEKFHQKGFTTL